MIDYYFGTALYIAAIIAFIALLLQRAGVTVDYIDYLLHVRDKEEVSLDEYYFLREQCDVIIPQLRRERQWKKAAKIGRMYRKNMWREIKNEIIEYINFE